MQFILKNSDGTYSQCETLEGGGYRVTGAAHPTVPPTVESRSTDYLDASDYGSNDTQISIGEVYNQLQVNCNVEEVEDVVDDPLDEEQLTPRFTRKSPLCTEYTFSGDGTTSFDNFYNVLHGDETTTWDGYRPYNHYIRTYTSNKWRCSADDVILGDHPQQYIWRHARGGIGRSFICELGFTKAPTAMNNAIINEISMKKYLIIPVNGNNVDRSRYDQGEVHPTESEVQACPTCVEYIGNMTGAYLSPADEKTTNYLVMKCKIRVVPSFFRQMCPQNGIKYGPQGQYYRELWHNWDAPLVRETIDGAPAYEADPYRRETGEYTYSKLLATTKDWLKELFYKDGTINLNHEEQGNGYYYFCKYNTNDTTVDTADHLWLMPYNDKYKSVKDLEFNYSHEGDSTDDLFKLDLLCCELKVGDKYCCEIKHEKAPSTFVWRTLEEAPTITYAGQTIKNIYIYIGPDLQTEDPADYVFDMSASRNIANNIDFTMNLEGEGMAIPINYSDKLSGQVSFKILGPVNAVWNQVTRTHPTFFRHTSWDTDSYFILSKTAYIMLEDFGITAVTDNAGNENDNDMDLVYVTAQNPAYIEKGEYDFDLVTQLTSDEALEKGVKTTVKSNSTYLGEDNLSSVYNTIKDSSAKPEEMFLNDYWPDLCQPAMIVESTLQDIRPWTTTVGIESLDPSTGSGRTFYTTGREINVKRCKTKLTLREIK